MSKQNTYLEHANITVNNIKESIRFFKIAFPDFKIRGGDNELKEWVHFGNNTTYIAINQAKQKGLKADKDYAKIGINHLGFVVQNVEEIAANLLKKGFKRDYPKEIEKYRIRDYFADSDGNQFEFIQYLSEIASEKNSYTH